MIWREELHPRAPDGEFAHVGGDWAAKVADAVNPHRAAVQDYAWGIGSDGNPLVGGLNTALRTGGTQNAEQAYLRDRLDAAFADAAPLPRAITTHRVVSGNSGLYYSMISSAKYKNGSWSEPGYMSTSTKRDSALDFDLDRHTVEIQLRIPAGAKVLRVDDLLGDANRYQQHEVLLPRGTTIRWTREPMPDGPNRVRLVGTVQT